MRVLILSLAMPVNKSPMQTPTTHESSSGRVARNRKKGVGVGNTLTTMDFGTTNKTLRQRGTAGRPKGNTLMPESQGRKRES